MYRKIKIAVLSLVFVLSTGVMCKAGDGFIKLEPALENISAIGAMEMDGSAYLGVTIPMVTVSGFGAELLNFNIGGLWAVSDYTGHASLSAQARLDALLHIFDVPDANLIQFGVILNYNCNTNHSFVGGFISKKFGK